MATIKIPSPHLGNSGRHGCLFLLRLGRAFVRETKNKRPHSGVVPDSILRHAPFEPTQKWITLNTNPHGLPFSGASHFLAQDLAPPKRRAPTPKDDQPKTPRCFHERIALPSCTPVSRSKRASGSMAEQLPRTRRLVWRCCG